MEENYDQEALFIRFKNRLESRRIISGDIHLDTDLISSIIKANPDLKEEYNNWLHNLCSNSRFVTVKGDILFSDIKLLWIDFFQVYVKHRKNKYRLLSPGPEAKLIKVKSIEELELQITEDVMSVVKKKWNNFLALPDLIVIINEVCRDIPRNTTYESTRAIKEAIMGNDETEELLHRMGYELFLDLQKIFEEVPIYWGKK